MLLFLSVKSGHYTSAPCRSTMVSTPSTAHRVILNEA